MDMIEEYFMERTSTFLWVTEYMIENGYSMYNCKAELKQAKKYMRMLNKYQRMKYDTV